MNYILKLRIYAFLIDNTIISLLIGVFFSFLKINKSLYIGTKTIGGLELNFSLEIITYFAFLIYFILFDIFFTGLTIGKKLLKIKVVNKNNYYELTFFHRFKRTLLKFISFTIFPISILVYFIYNKFILQDRFSIGKTVKIN